MKYGIELINCYGGCAYMDVRTLFQARNLDLDRFSNLMMEKKSVGLPWEDPVTNGVNAAKQIVDSMSDSDRASIEWLIVSSESGIDFGKSIGTYIHDYLGLSRNCSLFEVKQACYGGTAALHMALYFVASQASPGKKALVISTDIARAAAKHTYAEPSQGTGSTAMLVSDKPDIMEIDLGASGHYSYEVMDTCRPLPEFELGDPDVSLLSYLDCLENSFAHYASKVEDANFATTFDYLVFHTPFAGMVRGAHRKMMRLGKISDSSKVESDYQRRVVPSLKYCVQVGNIYSATVFLALCGLIDSAPLNHFHRVGLFSYGSGCSSQFYSGTIGASSAEKLKQMHIQARLDDRRSLSMDEYERILDSDMEWVFGIRDKEMDFQQYRNIYENHVEGKGLLVLKRVDGNFHREYAWA